MFSNGSAEITAVGIGSAGSRIVSLLSRQSLLVNRFVYVSCDRDDLVNAGTGEKILVESPVDQKLTPGMVRGLALGFHSKIREAVVGSEVVFVVAGLGGATGSGLSPVVAAIARDTGATSVGVVVMPFEFENRLKFYAGTSLKRLRAASRGVIVIDNDTLMRSSPEDSTLASVYDSANREAVNALGSLLSKSSETSVSVGLNKLLGTVLQDGYSLLGVSSSGSVDKAEEALAGAVLSISKLAEAKQVSRAVVMLRGDASLSAQEVGVVVKRLGSMISNQMVDVEYGVNYSGTPLLQVSLLASGFTSTKYDEYDPLGGILAERTIDDEMDSALMLDLEPLQFCD
jgi:cell division protein FtsZ